MSISTADCKKAIVDLCQKNGRQIIKEAYGSFEDVDLCAPNDELDHPATMQDAIAPMLQEKNWKREEKRKCDKYDRHPGLTERTFDCRPYDSQLRAYTYDDGTKIVDIRVQGE